MPKCKHFVAVFALQVILDRREGIHYFSDCVCVGKPLFLELHLEGIHTVPAEESQGLLLFAKLQTKLSPWSKAEITREAAVIGSIIFMDSIASKRLQNDIKKIYT